ncbi:MAG: AsmA-like C-terminal region-containing protein [Gracilimonas sp.]|nr:AsmA-like C-terminal region-containing protein [Gracilimonas sp.]
MKLFLKILAGFLVTLIILLVGVNIYFSDERLRNTVVPMLNENLGTEVEVSEMSLSLFRSFPNAGVSMEGVRIPDQDGETVIKLEELLLSVKIIPLISGDVNITELSLNSPEVYYTIYEDSTSNFDFLLADDPEEPATDEDGISLAIPNLSITNGKLHYNDLSSKTEILADGLNAQLSLQYADLIETDLTSELNSLTVNIDGENYLNDLALRLDQISTLDLDNEHLVIQEGSLAIRGLMLDLEGEIDSWSSEAMNINLTTSSSTDDFGELLTLVPPEYEEYITGLETRGELNIEGNISGQYSENQFPDYNFTVTVEDGYIKNNELPRAIEDIQLSFIADNNQIALQTFEAKAAQNTISVSGTLYDPLEDNPGYDLNIDSDIDLSTIESFYAISDFDVERMAGTLVVDVNAKGKVEDPENSELDGTIILSDGLIQYAGVSQPIENINVDMNATNKMINIQSASLTAAGNSLSFTGSINDPLDKTVRSIDVTGEANVDLATIKEFYPIDEDTLMMRGDLRSNIVLRGNLEPFDIQNLLQSSTLNLTNGYFAHSSVADPIEDITFEGTVSGNALVISLAKFKTGNNDLSVTGNIQEYLSDNPILNLTMDGNAQLGDVSRYYELKPWINELAGNAVMNLKAQGPAGDPLKIDLNGVLNLSEVRASGDSLALPVTDLGGKLTVSPGSMDLTDFTMKFGSSDIQFVGKMSNYLSFIKEDVSQAELPNVTGNYNARLLNMDEMIDWDEETDPNEPIPIELPDINANVGAEISKLIILGIDLTDVTGSGEMTPEKLILRDAKATMFEGNATGNMIWDIPTPTDTRINFSGTLDSLAAKAFFRDTGFLGVNSTIHEYIEGMLSAEVNYASDLNPALSPVLSTTDAEGSFGMTKARLANHPIQMKVANFLKVKELETLALDEWRSDFTIKNEVLTFKELNLTSDKIGLEMNGTHHLGNDKIDYEAVIALPGTFKKGLSTVIGEQAVNALTQENGTISVPLLITGNYSNPTVRPNEAVIKKIVEDYLKEKGGNILKKLFDGN